MPESVASRLASITPAMIETAIIRLAGDTRPQALDAAHLATGLCDQVGIGPRDPDRAEAYPQALLLLQATVAHLPGMRYVTGMT